DAVREVRALVPRGWEGWAPVLVLGTVVAPLANQVRLSPRIIQNSTYDPGPLPRLARELRNAAAAEGLTARPRIVTRRAYLTLETNAEHFPLPYTDLEGLNRYLSANAADFLFLQTPDLERPFGQHF